MPKKLIYIIIICGGLTIGIFLSIKLQYIGDNNIDEQLNIENVYKDFHEVKKDIDMKKSYVSWESVYLDSMGINLRIPHNWKYELLNGHDCVYDNNNESICLKVRHQKSFMQIKLLPLNKDLGEGSMTSQDVLNSILLLGDDLKYFRSINNNKDYQYNNMQIYIIKFIKLFNNPPIENKYMGKNYGVYSVFLKKGSKNYNIFYFIDKDLDSETKLNVINDMDIILSSLVIDS